MLIFFVFCMMNVDFFNVRNKWLQLKNVSKIVVLVLGFYFKDEFMFLVVFYCLLVVCMVKFFVVEQNDVL